MSSPLYGKCPACYGWAPIPIPINMTEVCPHPMGACPWCSTELELDQENPPGVVYRIPVVRARTGSRLSDIVPDGASTSGLVPDRVPSPFDAEPDCAPSTVVPDRAWVRWARWCSPATHEDRS